MKLNEITGKEKARGEADLLKSLQDGVFTKDGSHLQLKGAFNILDMALTSLKGCPRKMGGTFDCSWNKLTSLEGCPEETGGSFYASSNKLTSLEGCPHTVGLNFAFNSNSVKSLKDIHKRLKKMNGIFYAQYNPIESHVLGLLKIPGCRKIRIDNDAGLEAILNKYLPLGDLLDCQEELIEAGLEEFAQL